MLFMAAVALVYAPLAPLVPLIGVLPLFSSALKDSTDSSNLFFPSRGGLLDFQLSVQISANVCVRFQGGEWRSKFFSDLTSATVTDMGSIDLGF